MKAIVCTKYGSPDVLQLQEVARPVPQDDELLIKIHAASINARDWRLMRARPFFVRLMPGSLFRPKNKVLGVDFAGQVEAAGNAAGQFKPGDDVFGYMPSASGRGTFAEYVCATENLAAYKPENLTYAQAAAMPLAALTALQGLRDDGAIQPGQKVLIHGASGGVGTFAVQIAKVLGAEVTAVCSTRNLEMARALGAEHVIDYKLEDFTQNGQHYDLILAVNGYRPLADYLRALKPEGCYVVTGGSMAQLFEAASKGKRISKAGKQKILVTSLRYAPKNLRWIKELLDSGKIVPVIDRCYPLAEAAEALRYFENVHPSGKVVLSMI
jgi:NADPH:quinone reductase-like Zn-dependent oxidoreductase